MIPQPRALAALCTVFVIVLAAGCSAMGHGSLSSEAGFSGTLPNALGVAVFAPQCLLFCFVGASFSQGDAAQQSSETFGLQRKANVQAPSLVAPAK